MLPAEQVLDIIKPTGYRILVRIPQLDARMNNGLYRPDSSRALEETASVLGEVTNLGLAFSAEPKADPPGRIGVDHLRALR